MRTERDHLEMMRHPLRWPQPRILPLQHRTRKEPDGCMNLLGFVVADWRTGQAAPKVYVGCIYFLKGKTLTDFPMEEFPDLEALVRAGWEVN